MSVSRHWRQARAFSVDEWERILVAARAVIEQCRKRGTLLSTCVLDDNAIAFNGVPGCETFVLVRDPSEAQREHYRELTAFLPDDVPGSWVAFSFCKTRELPYDRAVVGVLSAARTISGDALQIGGDGLEHASGYRMGIECALALGLVGQGCAETMKGPADGES